MATWVRKLGGILVLIAVVAPFRVSSEEARSAEQTVAPSIVYVFTDDQDFRSLAYMPKVKSLLMDQGTTFPNYIFTDPVCCPSRTSMLTGKYVHNHGVRFNDQPAGGYEEYKRQSNLPTMATVLSAAGYRTGMLGKFLNGYGKGEEYRTTPAGWDRWVATLTLEYFGYELAEDGQLVTHDDREADYETDVMSGKALDYVRSTDPTTPLFLYYSIRAPHGPFVPAPRHDALFPGIGAPPIPSVNESDMSDKAPHMQAEPKLSWKERRRNDQDYRLRLQMLQAADEAIADLVATLEAQGRLDSTYIFFSSDNGYLFGEHRLMKKGHPYEEAIRFPLVVRGPGVAKGVVDPRLVSPVDLLPTFAALAGQPVPPDVDGRSIVPLLDGTATSWRTMLLSQGYSRKPATNPGWKVLRTETTSYIEWDGGASEYYDLTTDPYQLDSYHDELSERNRGRLAWHLDALATCAGASCRSADEGGPGGGAAPLRAPGPATDADKDANRSPDRGGGDEDGEVD